jgi:4-hydroxybenzoate polyprenyltransferase
MISSSFPAFEHDVAGASAASVRLVRPLIVDVETVLIHRDLLIDVLLSAIRYPTAATPGMLFAFARGLTAARRHLAQSDHFDPARLTYDSDVTTFLLQRLGEGRPVLLTSTRYNDGLVSAIAQHLGLRVARSAAQGDAGTVIEPLTVPTSDSEGYDYLGDADAELPPGAVRIALPAAANSDAAGRPGLRVWTRVLRVHQYSKNALVMVPLMTAHQFNWVSACQVVSAVLAFSLAASSAYILNDLLDVAADRAHPTKRHRPIASGAVAPMQAILAIAGLLAAAVGIGAALSPVFLATLLFYLALTTAYSFRLKRIAIADVVTLAVLYTIRVVAGAVAIKVGMSEWLFAFSLFIFMSLALVKRYVELRGRRPGERLMARDYQSDDVVIIAVLAAAAGFNAIVIFTLYISSDTVRSLYSHPQMLWVGCPVLMYWFARVMLLAQRGLIDDDPVIFALKDRVSWLSLGVIGIILFAAM